MIETSRPSQEIYDLSTQQGTESIPMNLQGVLFIDSGYEV